MELQRGVGLVGRKDVFSLTTNSRRVGVGGRKRGRGTGTEQRWTSMRVRTVPFLAFFLYRVLYNVKKEL